MARREPPDFPGPDASDAPEPLDPAVPAAPFSDATSFSPEQPPEISSEQPVTRLIAALKDSANSAQWAAAIVHHERLAPREPVFADPARPWPGLLQSALAARGLERLYAHQAQAVDAARMGRHVLVATPTASGKSLTYLLPVLESALANPDSRALYLSPLKALARDQLRTFNEWAGLLPEAARPTAAAYDGDTRDSRRRKLREEPPQLLLTNPEMLHLSLLPHHEAWSVFWAGLSHVIVDEVHTYRGVMGSHMAMVFRRLGRVAAYYGARPTFVFCSATVGNPAELASKLTGFDQDDVEVVEQNGAPRGAKHVVFVNPEGSPSTAAIRLLAAALDQGLRTIVYCKSRKMTELISMWAADKSGAFAGRISAYRAGFLPEERREIEARMASGDLLAVVATSALELGIDIGSLDVCILVGYPGSIMSTLQRGGRVGRSHQEAAVFLVAGEDALDQYFMRHPQELFTREPEAAVLNPANPAVAGKHLVCAAAELSLKAGEPFLTEPFVAETLRTALAKGEVLETASGGEYISRRKRPHREVDLRGAGQRMVIEDAATGQAVGQIDLHRAYRETHLGAVYLHRGRTYVVETFNPEQGQIQVREARVGYYTRARGEKTTEILEVYGEKEVLGTRILLGRLKVTECITGYEKRRTSDGRLLAVVPLDLPPLVFETEGLWLAIGRHVQEAAENARFHFMGGIHAVEHAAISVLPLLVLTDRNDLGGISTPLHPQVDGPAVFVYDGHPGGVGLARMAFARAEELLRRTRACVSSCPCELGCPSCVHSPKCGSGNRPIAKDAALFVLQALVEGTPPPPPPEITCPAAEPAAKNTTDVAAAPSADAAPAFEEAPAGRPSSPSSSSACPSVFPRTIRYGVLDIETRYSAAEVGGWHKASRMGVAVAVLYDAERDEYRDYAQDEIADLVARMTELEFVVGFNLRRFDFKVLSGIHRHDYGNLPCLDMLEVVHNRLGYRLSLDCLAKATLGAAKTADGLQSLAWWKEGRLDLISQYCRSDVAITDRLYRFGRDNGYLLFTNKAKQTVRLPVVW